ncbi:MAG: LicD family protein [Lachnospiraceae bacterium]|nr:LicD family protein [Lachnospiraceae bacterium]
MIDNVTKLRKVELELLEAFANVCEAHDLKWYVFFGTLLGTMRFDGFLPWDDDIDVAMPERDFTELCAHKEWFDERFFLQTQTDEGFLRFAKLRRNGTCAFDRPLLESLKQGGHHGIPIDIIPLVAQPGAESFHMPMMSSANKKDAVFHRSWFEPASEALFEDIRIRMPAAPRKILRAVYEDWDWPSGAQTCEPSYWFFDTERSYEDYVQRYTGMLEGIEGKKVFLFGAADSLRIWLERYGKRGKVVCTFDNDPGKWGTKAFGVDVRDPKSLPELMDADSRVIIVSLWHQEIGRQLERMGIRDYFVFLDYYYTFDQDGNRIIRPEDEEEMKKPNRPKWLG